MPGGSLSEGAPADITILAPDLDVTVVAARMRSKSKNTPFDGWTLRGGVAATIVGGRAVYLNDEFGWSSSDSETSLTWTNARRFDEKALKDLQQSEVLMLDGHFDYGNGYHGRVYLNPHQLFRHPSTIWRFAQDLLDLMPGDLVQRREVVAGPVTGGALLAHTIAGLLDSRRSLTHPPCSFAPFNYDPSGGFTLRDFYRREINGKRVLLADDVRNTGETFARCAALVAGSRRDSRGDGRDLRPLRSDRRSRRAEHRAREYRAPENYKAGDCPLCEPACRSRGSELSER